MDQIDISKEYSVPIPYLPQSMEGLTIAQISDLHVGPYIRERELRHSVELVNGLQPDLVVITGDVLDRHLSSLPDAVNGLRGSALRSAPTRSSATTTITRTTTVTRAGIAAAFALRRGSSRSAFRTLRNEVVQIGPGQDRLVLMGLDWLTTGPNDLNFFSYKPVETRRQLARMMQEAGPETPRILLAHHPDTFQEVPSEVGLTLSGHTHGGGQIILGNVDGRPIGIATLRFKYLSGLYQERGSTLYVNRGIGFLGLPIRINCPPEINQFKLVRPAVE